MIEKIPGEDKLSFKGMSQSEKDEIIANRRAGYEARLKDMGLWGRIETIPAVYRWQYAKGLLGEASKPEKMRLKCMDCCGFEDLKNNIGQCTDTWCQLWEDRPYQIK